MIHCIVTFVSVPVFLVFLNVIFTIIIMKMYLTKLDDKKSSDITASYINKIVFVQWLQDFLMFF